MDKAKLKEIWLKIYYFPHKVPSNLNSEEANQVKVELSAEDRKSKFRRYLTNAVSQGWHIEIENEFDAVISKKQKTGWFGSLLFLLLLLIFVPLAIFYLIYMVVTRSSGKSKLMKVWIDIYGDIKTNA